MIVQAGLGTPAVSLEGFSRDLVTLLYQSRTVKVRKRANMATPVYFDTYYYQRPATSTRTLSNMGAPWYCSARLTDNLD